MFPLINKRETGINLRRIMDMHGITAKDIQQYLELGCVQSVYRWLNGQSMPTIDNLYALSEFLKVPIDAIVCGNRMSVIPVMYSELYDVRDRRLYEYRHILNEKWVA